MPQAPSGARVCLLCRSRRSVLQFSSKWQWPTQEGYSDVKDGKSFHSSGFKASTNTKALSLRKHTSQYERPITFGKARVPSLKKRTSLQRVSVLTDKSVPLEPLEDVAKRCLRKMHSLMLDKAFQLETGLSGAGARKHFKEFEAVIMEALKENPVEAAPSRRRMSLSEAYTTRLEPGLYSRLKYMLAAMLANQKLQKSDIVNQVKLADLRYPAEWFTDARRMKRTIHLHIGPTNSGKTYHALKRLETAESGCYAGPLRLLAHEVYSRLNAKGKKCSLVTGDEVIMVGESSGTDLWSCTVEMVPLSKYLDVAVIDEIQMISDSHRGWAWTQAVLGLKAKELHLCGEARTLKLIQEIAASLGDKLVVHNYERLSPLQVSTRGLGGKFDGLQKGDCVVSFSRKTLHVLKKDVQKATGKQVAIVYGALPPETRAQQANLFNDQTNNYDVLVASDAIGMGLNLSIKRIVFETLQKFDGSSFVPIPVASIKQIGGRAGRYRTAVQDNASALEATTNVGKAHPTKDLIPPKPAEENIGYVTTLYDADLSQLRRAMLAEAPLIRAAGLEIPEELIIRFSAYFPPGTPLSYVFLRLHEIARLHPRYKLCNIDNKVAIADAIQHIEGLRVFERLELCCAPIDLRNAGMKPVLLGMARCLAEKKGGGLLEIPEINLEVLDLPIPKGRQSENYIMEVAAAHQAVTLYLWLSYRKTAVFHSQALAFHTKGLLQQKLDEALASAQTRRRNRAQPEADAEQQQSPDRKSAVFLAEQDIAGGQVDDEDDPSLLLELSEGLHLGDEEGEPHEPREEDAQHKPMAPEDGTELDFIPPQAPLRDEAVRGS